MSQAQYNLKTKTDYLNRKMFLDPAGPVTIQRFEEVKYNKLKNKYQLMWDQKDCEGYLKTAAVIQVYVDQSISTNTFYSPKHFPDRKVPSTLIAKNLMLFHKWGGKTFYYSLIDKQGSKGQDEPVEAGQLEVIDFDDQEDCESCKL